MLELGAVYGVAGRLLGWWRPGVNCPTAASTGGGYDDWRCITTTVNRMPAAALYLRTQTL